MTLIHICESTVKHLNFARLNFPELKGSSNSRALSFREFLVNLDSTGPQV